MYLEPSSTFRRRQARVLPFMLAAGLLLPGTRAYAQSIDYGAMEQLFAEPVTTSVTGKPQRATDAPANIEIITQDDIRRSGATSIPEVLQFVTGLDVRVNGFGDADVGIRGYNQIANPHLMVLVDGRQVYMVDYGRIFWAAIPVQLAEIRQIEVIKGPNSALYGFNAVGGVINIITFDPRKDQVNSATLSGGTQSYRAGSAVATGKVGDNTGLRLSLGGFQAHDFDAPMLPADDQASRRSPFTGLFNADIRSQLTPDVEAFANATYGDTRLADRSPAGPFISEEQHTNSVRLGMNANTPIGLLSLSAYRNQVLVNDFEVLSTGFQNHVAHQQYESQTVTVIQANDLVKLGANHAVRFGLEYRVNAAKSPLLNGSLSDSIYAASIMWDWQVTPAVSFTNAARLDYAQVQYNGSLLAGTGVTAAQYNTATFTGFSFNSGVVWKVTEDDTLRLTGARGVQLPTLMDQGLQAGAGAFAQVSLLGSPTLKPSIIYNVELDYDRAISAIGSTLRTGVFGQRTDDIISWPFGGQFTITPSGIPAFFSSNVGYSTAIGLKSGIRGHSDAGWRWNASYALVATTDHTSLNQSQPLTSTVNYACSAPRNVVIVGLGYSQDRWETDLMGRWQSSFCDFRAGNGGLTLQRANIQNYVMVNARIGYNVMENLTVALVAQQLNDARLTRTIGPQYQRRIIASVTIHF